MDLRDYASAVQPVDMSAQRARKLECLLTDEETTEYQKFLGKLPTLAKFTDETRPVI
jgi:hypothetical protein